MRSLPYFLNNMNNPKTDLRFQHFVDGDAEAVVVPSGKTFKIKLPANKAATMIGKLITKAQIGRDETSADDYGKMVVNMNNNRKLAPKVCSIAILHNPIYIFLFHWIYWRYLHLFYTQSDYKVLLEAIFATEELKDFFTNMGFLNQNNTIAIVAAVTDTTTTKAKQD